MTLSLHELVLGGARPEGGRDRRRLERFAEMREGLFLFGQSHPGLFPLASRCLPTFSIAKAATAGLSF